MDMTVRVLEDTNRVGETFHHPKYGEYSIVEYLNCEKVRIRFSRTGYECYSSYNHIQNKEVKDYFHRGKYGACKGCSHTDREAYKTWSNMIYRCNNSKGYSSASICDEWLDFSVFLSWYDAQYKESHWHLDKDILSNGQGIYSPQTCCFLPPQINTFFAKHKKAKGYSYNKRRKKYESYCRDRGKYVHLGMYEDSHSARLAYLRYKRSLLEELIEPYLDRISVEIYNAMKQYLW